MPFIIKNPFRRPPFLQKPITLASVRDYRNKEPSRIDFKRTHANALKRVCKANCPKIVGSFSLPFEETIRPIFESATGLRLLESADYGNFWRSIQSEEEFTAIGEWIVAQGSRIFLRDCLNLSIAFDCNFEDATNGTFTYTRLGGLEHRAKSVCDAEAVAALSSVCADTIQNLPYYRDAEVVVAVPPMSAKKYDLPSQVAARVSVDIKKKNLTDCFVWDHAKQKPLKGALVEEKWALLEATGLRLNCPISNKSDVILIDDKYQSGTTMQFAAMKLREAGARYIFGISLVKTLRDTDNASKG